MMRRNKKNAKWYPGVTFAAACGLAVLDGIMALILLACLPVGAFVLGRFRTLLPISYNVQNKYREGNLTEENHTNNRVFGSIAPEEDRTNEFVSERIAINRPMNIGGRVPSPRVDFCRSSIPGSSDVPSDDDIAAVKSRLESSQAESIRINIRNAMGDNFEINCNKDTTIRDIKILCYDRYGIPLEQQHLVFNKRRLEENYTVEHYNIVTDSKLKTHLICKGKGIEKSEVRNNPIVVKGANEEITSAAQLRKL